VNVLRRLPLPRLLLLCGIALAVGIGSTALALALGGGPTPPPKGLADAVHDALAGADAHPIEGVSARIQFTNHLVEGASLASGSNGEAGQLASSPLLSGASGRLWISKDGRVRMELQSEKGDSQILYDDFDAIMAAAHLLSADGAELALDAAAWNAAYDYYGHDLTGVSYADEVLARAIGWSQHGFCINCGTDQGLIEAVHAAYGAPVQEALSTARIARAAPQSRRTR
jgi:hypothetical protein